MINNKDLNRCLYHWEIMEPHQFMNIYYPSSILFRDKFKFTMNKLKYFKTMMISFTLQFADFLCLINREVNIKCGECWR